MYTLKLGTRHVGLWTHGQVRIDGICSSHRRRLCGPGKILVTEIGNKLAKLMADARHYRTQLAELAKIEAKGSVGIAQPYHVQHRGRTMNIIFTDARVRITTLNRGTLLEFGKSIQGVMKYSSATTKYRTAFFHR